MIGKKRKEKSSLNIYNLFNFFSGEKNGEEEEDIDFDDPFLEEVIENKNEIFEDDHPNNQKSQNNLSQNVKPKLKAKIRNPNALKQEEEEKKKEDKMEDEDEDNTNKGEEEIFLPNTDYKLEPGEELVFDNESYKMLHRFTTEWPIPSFDFFGVKQSENEEISDSGLKIGLITGYQTVVENNDNKNNNNTNNFKNDHKISKWMISNLHETDMDSDDEDDATKEDNPNILEDPSFQITDIKIPSDINRLKVSPNNNYFAIYCEDSTVALLDNVNNNNKILFNFSNINQLGEGWGLGFNCDSSVLAVGGTKNKILLVDINNKKDRFINYNSAIEDIEFSPVESNVMATVSRDGILNIWDLRQSKVGLSINNNTQCDLNVLSWNKLKNNNILVGDDKGILNIWDMKNTSVPSHTYKFHKKRISSVNWSPHFDTLFASTGDDNICVIWDVMAENDAGENNILKNNKVPDQVLFIHMGQEQMKEVKWCPSIPSMLVTCAFNSFNVFVPQNIYQYLVDDYPNLYNPIKFLYKKEEENENKETNSNNNNNNNNNNEINEIDPNIPLE